MAKLPFSTDIVARLRGKYGWSGGAYRQLIGRIIAANNERTARAVARVKVGKMHQQAAGLTKRWKRLVLPSIAEAIPKRSVFIRKGAEQGKILTDDLRAGLSRDLREAMEEMRRSGMQLMITQTGTTRGRLNPRLADVFEQRIVDRFAGYAKRDPEIGVPPNVRAIAVTETRATINEVKADYFRRFVEKNPGVEVIKRWKHNMHLIRTEPRPGHVEMDKVEVPWDQPFEVPEWVKEKGDWVRTARVIRMMHPHDPSAAAQDVINCHCLPPDEGVAAFGLRASIRAVYSGQMVTVKTKHGAEFRATPNHPVLTRFGWVKAGRIQVGTEIVCVRGRQVGGTPELDEYYVPPAIEQIHDLAAQFRNPMGEVPADVDFHGDRAQGEVEIVPIDRMLCLEVESAIKEHLPEFSLALSHSARPLLSTHSAMNARSAIGRGGETRAFIGVHPGVSTDLRSGHGLGGAMRSGCLRSTLRDSPTGVQIVLSIAQASGFDATRTKSLEDRPCVAVESSSELTRRGPGLIELDEVVSVNVRPYSGHVYNLHTDSGLYYAGKGGNLAIVHNCDVDYVARIAPVQKARKLQGRTEFQGLPISIENRRGSIREGVDPDGTPWRTKMRWPYGYVRGTEGTDSDEVDVFVGPQADSPEAYIVHVQDPETGEYDEDKVFLGFASADAAFDAFTQHYDDPLFFGGIEVLEMDALADMLEAAEGERLVSWRRGVDAEV